MKTVLGIKLKKSPFYLTAEFLIKTLSKLKRLNFNFKYISTRKIYRLVAIGTAIGCVSFLVIVSP